MPEDKEAFMRKMKYVVIALVVLWSYLFFDSVMGLAMAVDLQKEETQIQGMEMQATAYCLTGTPASGQQTSTGIVASKPEWIGKKMMIYLKDKNGNQTYLGTYDVEDTGGNSIRSGKVVDIWMPTRDECLQFGRRNVVVYLVE